MVFPLYTIIKSTFNIQQKIVPQSIPVLNVHKLIYLKSVVNQEVLFTKHKVPIIIPKVMFIVMVLIATSLLQQVPQPRQLTTQEHGSLSRVARLENVQHAQHQPQPQQKPQHQHRHQQKPQHRHQQKPQHQPQHQQKP